MTWRPQQQSIPYKNINYGMWKILSITAFLTFITAMCNSCSSPSGPPIIAVDTTSHNFTWTKYTFGGPYGSSVFSDAAIVNDSLIYVVGSIYLSDSLGRLDPVLYNLGIWDGKQWTIQRLKYFSQGHEGISSLRTVFALDRNNIWFAGGGLFYWNGNNFMLVTGFNSVWGPVAQNKIWASGPGNLFVVGNSGEIAHYDGNYWSRMISGTSVDLSDVWGTSDGKIAWATGHSYDGQHSVLLKYENNVWRTLWKRDGTTAVTPLGYEAGSVWGTTSAFVTSTNGIFRLDGDSSYTNITSAFPDFIYRIRGNSNNDFVAMGDRQTIWHYNGADIKKLMDGLPTQPFYSGTMKGNTVVAVGTDFSIEFGAGLIVIGKR